MKPSPTRLFTINKDFTAFKNHFAPVKNDFEPVKNNFIPVKNNLFKTQLMVLKEVMSL